MARVAHCSLQSETCPLLGIRPDGRDGRQEREGEFLDPLPRCCLGLTVARYLSVISGSRSFVSLGGC